MLSPLAHPSELLDFNVHLLPQALQLKLSEENFNNIPEVNREREKQKPPAVVLANRRTENKNVSSQKLYD